MKKTLKGIALVLALVTLGLSWPAWQFYKEIRNARSEDPLVPLILLLLSGLCAATPILLLAFKDAILGLVGGIHLVSLDMVRPGDWIELDGHYGEVVHVGMRTVALVTADPGRRAAMRYFYAYELPRIDAWLGVVARREDVCRTMQEGWF